MWKKHPSKAKSEARDSPLSPLNQRFQLHVERIFDLVLVAGLCVGFLSCGKQDLRNGWDTLRGKEHEKRNDPSQTSEDALGSFSVSRVGTLRHVSQAGVWKATFTASARTVTLAGPERTFQESTARDSVTHSTWVRSLSQPFQDEVDMKWLRAALAANERSVPDHLAIGMQYIAGAKPKLDADRRQIAGDASYGPIGDDGVRALGSDVPDYLRTKTDVMSGTGTASGVDDDVSTTELLARRLSLDCSGFIRMVYGFRDAFAGSGYAQPYVLSGLSSNTHEGTSTDSEAIEKKTKLPRTAESLFLEGPGVVIIEDSVDARNGLGDLRPGDLLFFRADETREAQLDHVAIYLGLDDAKKRRFLSSRKSADGPTLGDTKGASTLDGTGLYARTFRAARRF